MIYKHRRTGDLYRVIAEGFSVERQKPSIWYMSLETGAFFDRDANKFYENFGLVNIDPQRSIEPKEPHS